ncbi:transcriptional regulator [Sphaerisporangium melleum]|uniref:Transcriptional regulator n=1 Tax=Sphaerisporangium melleum TaxID=321316 RepID=A0A917QXF7_9ACTN|nr:helix-turn-helix transcriptional regulator [Sphaerisporangium melleum]GGK74882.1 transcriptional regulator [Sphaerisporangium melleum]GII70974.1 transcriptional regulator [Sphaerisporangium melleum]
MARAVDDGMRRIGENVRAARRYRGMSLETLAGLTGRSKGWLSKIENGHARLERRSDIRDLADALEVSASDLLGEPAPVIRPRDRAYGDVVRLREVFLDASLDSPLDIQARPLRALVELINSDIREYRRNADDAQLATALPPVLAELHMYAATGDERDRATALRLLVDLCTSATNVLRHLGQVDLAWIAADRAERAARLLNDPVMIGAAAFAQAGSRPAATVSRALRDAERAADMLAGHLGDERTAHEVYGMLQLYAALARHLQNDAAGAADRIAEAGRIAERLGEQPDGSTGEGWQSFGPANVGVWRTMLAVEAGKPEEALEVASGVEAKALRRRSRKAALAIEQGRALAMLGRSDAAVRQLRHAERLSVASVHKNPMVRELVADMYDNAISRDLRGLAWRMNLI